MREPPIDVIALDCGGVLTEARSRLDGRRISQAMAHPDIRVIAAEGFIDEFDGAHRLALGMRRPDTEAVDLNALVRLACLRSGTQIPEVEVVLAIAHAHLPDSPISSRAAAAVRDLHARGFTIVMAANTVHPREKRERTLEDAGIRDCFSELFLSSELLYRKPERAFYKEVLTEAGCAPDRVLFVGDRVREDVEGPLAAGMRAVLVHTPDPPRPPVPDGVPVLDHIDGLPALLEEMS